MKPSRIALLSLFAVWLVAVSLIHVWVASTPAEAKPPTPVSRAEQYSRTCAPWRFYGFSDGDNVSDIVASQQTPAVPVLIPWGTQVEVSCNGAIGAYAVACFHQSASMSLDLSAGCGDGCGRIDDSTLTQDGHAACFVVPSGGYKYRRADKGVFRTGGDNSTFTVLTREGYCTAGTFEIGSPCDVNGDCGAGGACSRTDGDPKGVFMSIAVSNTSLNCQVEICI